MDELKLTLQIVDEETGELYGTIENIQEYGLSNMIAQSSICNDVQNIVDYAKSQLENQQ